MLLSASERYERLTFQIKIFRFAYFPRLRKAGENQQEAELKVRQGQNLRLS